MVNCSAFSCKSRSEQKKPGITFHSFPKDMEKCKIWISNMKISGWVPTKNSRLCSKHFEESCFYKTDSYLRVRLLTGAIPTIFPDLKTNLQPKIARKRQRASTKSQDPGPSTSVQLNPDTPRKERYQEIFPDQTELLAKSEAVNGSRQIDDMITDKCKITNEGLSIKEDLEFDEFGSSKLCPNQTELVKIEKSEAINESDEMYDVNVEDWSIKNEFIIKEEDLESNEISLTPNHVGQEKDEVFTDPEDQNDHQSSNLIGRPIQHNIKPVKDETFKCDQCKYQTNRGYSLKVHLRIHMDPEEPKTYKCNQCEYQTNRRYSLKLHFRRHMNRSELNMYKCEHCAFQTIEKAALNRHLLRHMNPNDVNMFECDQCQYRTSRAYNLKIHLLRHKNPDEINMYKCEQCDYQTFEKYLIKRHLLRHRNPGDVDIFKCDHCNYQTVYKDHLTKHFLIHKNAEDVNIFKCNQCNYQSKRKSSLKRHIPIHNSDKMFKCDKCEYHSKWKYQLKRHSFRHNESDKLQMFKCEHCNYETVQKHNLRRHIQRHHKVSVQALKCGQCNFETNYKDTFKLHIFQHKKSVEVDQSAYAPSISGKPKYFLQLKHSEEVDV